MQGKFMRQDKNGKYWKYIDKKWHRLSVKITKGKNVFDGQPFYYNKIVRKHEEADEDFVPGFPEPKRQSVNFFNRMKRKSSKAKANVKDLISRFSNGKNGNPEVMSTNDQLADRDTDDAFQRDLKQKLREIERKKNRNNRNKN